MSKPLVQSTGRRKRAVARVRVRTGSGQVVVNGRAMDDYFPSRTHRMQVVHRAGKLGLGTATVAAMQYAIDHDYDYVLNMDADFSHHPRYIPAILAAMDHGDVAIGSRYCPGG